MQEPEHDSATTTPVRVENWMLATVIATGALPLVFSHFELRAARAANSPALIADARGVPSPCVHHRFGVRKVINAEPAVVEVKRVTGRNAGRFRFIEAGVTVRVAELDRAEAVIRGRIETKVRTAVSHVERVGVHIEAPATPCVRYAVPLSALDGTEPAFRRGAFLRVRGRAAQRWDHLGTAHRQ